LVNKTGNIGFGNLTGLRPINPIITTSTNTTENNNRTEQHNNNNEIEDVVEDDTITNNTTYCTKIMRITPNTYERLRQYSAHFHPQPISYDEIFQELLDFYNEHHQQKYFLT
jgi:hypothetical protein